MAAWIDLDAWVCASDEDGEDLVANELLRLRVSVGQPWGILTRNDLRRTHLRDMTGWCRCNRHCLRPGLLLAERIFRGIEGLRVMYHERVDSPIIVAAAAVVGDHARLCNLKPDLGGVWPDGAVSTFLIVAMFFCHSL